jgi:hypothetical protein
MDYISKTSTTLSANLLFMEFNLHAATPGNSAETSLPRLSSSDLPSKTELVGKVFSDMTAQLPYQPSELQSQRANLNNSWYTVSDTELPAFEYYSAVHLPGGDQSTPDGWPSEYFAEVKRFNRVLLGWGAIDPRMEGYDFNADSDIVYPQGYISSAVEISANSVGVLESGCFYDGAKNSVAQMNSSWATSALDTTSTSNGPSDRLWNQAGNMTSCGITPTLNLTLANETADVGVSPYVQFVQSTVWNWLPGEPRNATSSGSGNSDSGTSNPQFRCALMETSNTVNASRWRVEYCNNRHRAACRVDNQPYIWQISDEVIPFSAAEAACQANTSFAAPRTGLENTYLYQHIVSLPETSGSGLFGNGDGIWVNFNSLDIEACWVTTGPNGTCPYFVDEEALHKRTVLVPTIAALVVLLLTALTLFVKCNENRRNSRKRVRGEGGWDYEGVPS